MTRRVLLALALWSLGAVAAVAQVPQAMTFYGTATIVANVSTPLALSANPGANIVMGPGSAPLPAIFGLVSIWNTGVNPLIVCWRAGTQPAMAGIGCEAIPSGFGDWKNLTGGPPPVMFSAAGTTIGFNDGSTVPFSDSSAGGGGGGGGTVTQGPGGASPWLMASAPVAYASVALNATVVTTAGTPVAALTGAQHAKGGWICNWNSVGTLFVNDSVSAGTAPGGSTVPLPPAPPPASNCFTVPPGNQIISVNSDTAGEAIYGEGYN